MTLSNKRLLKDIIIPAGTIFQKSPWKTTKAPGHFDCVIGLTKDSYGTFDYDFENLSDKEQKEYFEDVKGTKG